METQVTCKNCRFSISKTYICDECGRCRACYCACEHRQPYLSRNKPLTFWNDDKLEKNPSKRYVGVEIEVGDYNRDNPRAFYKLLHKIVKKWNAQVGSDNAFEIQTAPANGDLFIKQIDEFTKILKNYRATADTSCGLHVHVDGRDLGPIDLKKLAIVYVVLEDYLFTLVPKWRRQSRWCMPVKDKVKNCLASGKETYIAESLKTYVYGKSVALNFYPLNRLGTIECRLFAGTLNKKDITHWAMFWAQLVDFVKKSSVEEVSSLKNPNDVFKVAVTQKVRNWLKNRQSIINANPEVQVI